MRDLTLPVGLSERILDATPTGSSFKTALNNKGDSGEIEILVFDEIGDDFFGDAVSGKSVAAALDADMDAPAHFRVNSGGGSVYDAALMMNAMHRHRGHVRVTIEGLCYSAATFLVAHADHVAMYAFSDFGIHEASGGVLGTASDREAYAKWIRNIDEHIVETYAARTGIDEKELWDYMKGGGSALGTVFPAKQAVELGFADELIESKKRKPYKEGNQANVGFTDTDRMYESQVFAEIAMGSVKK